jgi:hypothetical protein
MENKFATNFEVIKRDMPYAVEFMQHIGIKDFKWAKAVNKETYQDYLRYRVETKISDKVESAKHAAYVQNLIRKY